MPNSDEPLRALARVVRFEQRAGDTPGVAAMFVSLDKESRARIDALVRQVLDELMSASD